MVLVISFNWRFYGVVTCFWTCDQGGGSKIVGFWLLNYAVDILTVGLLSPYSFCTRVLSVRHLHSAQTFHTTHLVFSLWDLIARMWYYGRFCKLGLVIIFFHTFTSAILNRFFTESWKGRSPVYRYPHPDRTFSWPRNWSFTGKQVQCTVATFYNIVSYSSCTNVPIKFLRPFVKRHPRFILKCVPLLYVIKIARHNGLTFLHQYDVKNLSFVVFWCYWW